VASTNPQSTAQIAGHALYPMLIPFPIAGGYIRRLSFLTQSQDGVEHSIFVPARRGSQRIRNRSAAWHHMAGNLTAVALSLWNWYQCKAKKERGGN
jgi:uncharacterized membrane protein